MTVAEIAAWLDDAEQAVRSVDQLAEDLSIDDAYSVQDEVIKRRHRRGERVCGTKLGFTSQAKMAQMGVDQIIVGQLTDAMRVADGATIGLGGLIHPRIEPEVAFRLTDDIDPDDPDVDVAAFVDAVAPALEIIDSRYRDFRFRLADVIADNTSAAAFVIGEWQPIPSGLGRLTVELAVDDVVVETGDTAAILGHPLDALRALGPIASGQGIVLRAGSVILAGAATAAVPLTGGRVEARVASLGRASVLAVPGD